MAHKVSIILVFYNDQQYLAETLDAMLAQTFQDFEIILLDNGSTDQSRNIVENYAKKDRRIKIITNKKNYHLGGENLAKLVKATSGEYIKLFCADDIMLPNCLAKQVEFLDHNPDHIACFSHMQCITETGKLKKKLFKCALKNDRFTYLNHIFYQGNAFAFPAGMVKKSALEPQEFDNRLRHFFDVTLWIKLLKKGECKVLDESLVQYRLRGKQGNVSDISKDRTRETLYLFEMNFIYDDFFNLRDLKTYQKIFPESNSLIKSIKTNETELLEFVTCLLLYNRENFSPFHFSVYRNIALQKMLTLSTNKKLMAKITEKFGYTNLDLYQLAEKYNEGLNYEFASRKRNKISRLFYKLVTRKKFRKLAKKNKILL